MYSNAENALGTFSKISICSLVQSKKCSRVLTCNKWFNQKFSLFLKGSPWVVENLLQRQDCKKRMREGNWLAISVGSIGLLMASLS